MDLKAYEEMLEDTAQEMGKRFGEKAGAVFLAFAHPPTGSDPVTNTQNETGICLGEIDQFYLSLIKDAEQKNRRAVENLGKAIQIMREMRRANDGK